jgi:hypothetical protein
MGKLKARFAGCSLETGRERPMLADTEPAGGCQSGVNQRRSLF